MANIRTPLNLRVVSDASAGFMCQISADRTWKCIHLKRAIEDETGVVAREMRLMWDLPLECGSAGAADSHHGQTGLRPDCQWLPTHSDNKHQSAYTGGGSDGQNASPEDFDPAARPKRMELALDEDRLDLLPEGDLIQLTLTRRSRLQAEWLERVKEFGLQLRLAPPSMIDDREVVYEAVKKNWKAFEYASERLRSDSEIAYNAIKQDSRAAGPSIKPWVTEVLWAQQEFVIKAVQLDFKLLKYASVEMQDDKACAMAAVSTHYGALHEISDNHLQDYDVVMVGVRQSQDAMRFVDDDMKELLWGDYDAVFCMVSKNWHALENVEDQELLNDLPIALAAVKQDWRALKFLGEHARTDREVVLTAVEQDWAVIATVLQDIPLDREVVAAMVAKSWHILAYVQPEFRDDKEICISGVSQDWQALNYVSERLRGDSDVVSAAVIQYGPAIALAGPALANDPIVMKSACTNSGACLEMASEECRSNPEVVMAAIGQDWHSIRFATDIARTNKDVVYSALLADIGALDYATPELLSDPVAAVEFMKLRIEAYKWLENSVFCDPVFLETTVNGLKVAKSVYLGFIERNWQCLEFLPDKLRRSKEVVLKAIKANPAALMFADRQLWEDDSVLLAAIKQDWTLIEQLPEALQEKAWNDHAIALACCKQDWHSLEKAGEIDWTITVGLWEDMDIALSAIAQDPAASAKMGKDLWAERDIAIAVCKHDWKWLKQCPRAFQKDHYADQAIILMCLEKPDGLDVCKDWDKGFWEDTTVMLAACQKDWHILEKAPNKAQAVLWSDWGIVSEAVRQDWQTYLMATKEMMSDRTIALQAVKQNWKAIEKLPFEVSEKVWADDEIVMAAVKQDGMCLGKALPAIQDDKPVVLAAVKQNWKAVDFASEKLREDTHVALAAVNQDWQCLLEGRSQLHSEKLWADKDVVKAVVVQKGRALEFAGDKVRADKKVVLIAVEQDGLALEFAAEVLKKDRDIVEMAVKQNGAALDFAAEHLQKDDDYVTLAMSHE